jgi:hypothetical protein
MLASLRDNYGIVPPIPINGWSTQNVITGVHFVWRENDLRQLREWMNLSAQTAIRGMFGRMPFICVNGVDQFPKFY